DAACWKEMLMSWPDSALVAGVKIGSGNSEDSASPRGRRTPQTVSVWQYSFQPEPARYPRTTHSIGNGWAFFTIMARPASLDCQGWSSGGNGSSARARRWFATMSAV